MKRQRPYRKAEVDSRRFSPQRAAVTIIAIVALCLSLAQAAIAATGQVNYNTVHQQLEGFGGAAVYDVTTLTSHTQREAIYDLLFRDLGLDVLRIRNTYGYDDSGSNMASTKTIVAAARTAGRNPALKLELVPWSPQASLKSNGSINGGTLAKDANGNYVYASYGTWWADSLDSWAASPNSLVPDYISTQNEPDWEPSYDGCKFLATESSSYAGYDKAFEAIYNAIYARQGSNTPKMIAPETMGFGNSQSYITALYNRGQMDHIYGFSHHLYSDGSYDSPDGMISGMESYATNYGDYYDKPLFMTEYVKNNATPDFDMALKMAWHIHNTLVHEGVTSFYWWTLFRGTSSTGGVINLPTTSTYTIRDLYWFLKHYTYFTDPNWYVVDATTNPSDNLRMTAFKNPANDKLTVVILNKSSTAESLTLNINDFSPSSSAVYRSSSTEHWVSLGAFSNPLSLPALSITTISFSAVSGPTQTLNVSSTEGGSVTTPGEGNFQYAQGTNTTIIATADSSYHFVNWTGSAVDAGKVTNPNAASTTVLMDANYAVVANFQANPPSTDVEILGSWLTGTTHAKETGYNRALVFIAHEESTSGTPTLTSVTYGGQAMTKVIERSAVSGYGNYVAAFILNEAGVAAATTTTFTPTWSGTTSSVAYASVFLSNVNQTTPVGPNDSNATTAATPNPIATNPLTTSDGDMVIDAATCGNNGSYTLNSGFTEGTDQSVGTNGLTGVTGYKHATGANETPSATYSATVNRQAIIGFVIQAAPLTFSDCNAVQDANLGLTSDLNGDCYVNYWDLKIIADHWLNTDCNETNNYCGWADIDGYGSVNFFDFSDFVVQWMQCNNPEDPGCTQNQ